jgi:Glycosyl transferase family 8
MIRSFFEWFKEAGIDSRKPWLVLGKGPSFAKRNHYDLSLFYTLALNHAVRELRVMVAHMIDYGVVDDCGEALLTNAQYVLLPWIPHINNIPGSATLAELARGNQFLRRLDEQGRLLCYNLSTARHRKLDGPVVRVRYFSAEAALNLLSTAGVRTVRSLGLDGGAAYSDEFDDLKDKTLLVNARESFDLQFQEIARCIMTTGIDYAPLDIESPIRVYVGTTDEQMLAVKVLEYSIRKHASMSVEVYPLHLSQIKVPVPKDPKNRPRTPFSFQRFLIPALAGHRGRAIYIDSDMQVFRDIRSLWTLPFKGADLLAAQEPDGSARRPQFSVMLLNCETLQWDIEEIVNALDAGDHTYEQLMYEMAPAKVIRTDISEVWNSLERYDETNTALVHYTDMPTQPWVSRRNRLGYLWVRALFEAVEVGFISLPYVKDQVAKGFVRPSLLYQLGRGKENPISLPTVGRLMDRKFVPPYRNLDAKNNNLGDCSTPILDALALRYYEKRADWMLAKKKRKNRFPAIPSAVTAI